MKKKYLINAGMMWALMFLTYVGTMSVDSINPLFMRKSIVCFLAIFIGQLAINSTLFKTKFLVPLFIYVWWHIFIIFKFFCLKDAGAYDYELFIANYGLTAMCAMQHLFQEHFKSKLCLLLGDLIHIAMFFIPVVTMVHYCIYGTVIAFEEVYAIYHSNFRESVEWIQTYMGMGYFIAIIVFSIGLYISFSFIRNIVENRFLYNNDKTNVKRNTYLVIAATIALYYYPIFTLTETDWVEKLVQVIKYDNKIKSYGNLTDIAKDNISFADKSMIINSPHTVIMVIGESTARDYISLYNDKFPYPNTPWMKSLRNNDNAIVFNNVYACQSVTQQVLENLLTEKDFYNKKDVLESFNIIDLMKLKGYKTYWITNMAGSNTFSTFGTIAERADVLIRKENSYDDSMIEALSQINPNENNFVVLHGNGSHAAYSHRYPPERTVFKDNNVEAEYSNAVNYVDTFLKQVFEYGNNNLNMQVMMYFSDHGENLIDGHGPGNKTFDKVRIPMFVYVGDEYKKENISRFNILSSHQDTYYTNDMMYNTICGIVKAESNYYDSQKDLSSDKYNQSMENLITFGGERKVTDDPNFK